jgi:hypothetical protein
MPAPASGSPGFTLARDAWGRVVLQDHTGQEHVGVVLLRAFPISDPHRAISICDRVGHEVAYIDSVEQLPLETRQILEAELARREFMPTILRILNNPRQTEPSHWRMLTDRGETEIRLEREDDVRQLDDHRVLVVDSNGIRYQVADLRKLDSHSRRVFDRLL